MDGLRSSSAAASLSPLPLPLYACQRARPNSIVMLQPHFYQRHLPIYCNTKVTSSRNYMKSIYSWKGAPWAQFFDSTRLGFEIHLFSLPLLMNRSIPPIPLSSQAINTNRSDGFLSLFILHSFDWGAQSFGWVAFKCGWLSNPTQSLPRNGSWRPCDSEAKDTKVDLGLCDFITPLLSPM